MKKTIAALLALMLAFAMVLSGCGDNKTETSSDNQNSDGSGNLMDAVSADNGSDAEGGETTYFVSNDSDDTVSLGTPDKALDPATVYKTLRYTPEMLYGTYKLTGGETAKDDYISNMEYFKFNEAASSGCGEINENGLFTFSVPYATETKTYQYVFFYVNDRSLILTDGVSTHYYTYKEEDFHAYKLGTVLGDDVDVDGLSDDETKEILAVQNSILSDLEEAFASKDIDAEIDKATGRVTLDSNILFANDSYELSADGKKSLDDFLDVYTSVVLSDKNKDSVANIIVEGHTDTNGTEEYNQNLSEKRAEAVADYCISVQPELKDKIETVGYAAKYPVYGEDGEVDMAASRRVVFKFKLELKK